LLKGDNQLYFIHHITRFEKDATKQLSYCQPMICLLLISGKWWL